MGGEGGREGSRDGGRREERSVEVSLGKGTPSILWEGASMWLVHVIVDGRRRVDIMTKDELTR